VAARRRAVEEAPMRTVSIPIVVLAAALAACSPKRIPGTENQGRDSVRLLDAPCHSATVLDRIDPPLQSGFRAATAVVDGRSYSACWHPLGNAAYLLYEDGDQGLIPFAALTPEQSV
jgi:hypothetical protein